ncbi:hypothetical protein QCA50_001043 [Cerrena zonata]|uniref:MFS general substrate transporter n=1 Tax=Cerrena zonata TaxID=2478898 RepID=A0AAW0GW36_9APHY
MNQAEVLPTAFDLPVRRPWVSLRASRNNETATSTSIRTSQSDPEFKLPKRSSLAIILLTNVLMQISFFIIVSSSNLYAEHLGGTATFSGIVIGIPTAISGLTLLPLMKYDQGRYRRPLNFACASSILGHVLYALAYKANWLYLILLGRMVSGLSFTFFMYSKRYCSDSRIVGLRRRTTLAGWLVVGQAVGFSFGPFIGGVLYKVGFSNSVFNGFTSPAWLMAAVWAAFWALTQVYFEDVQEETPTTVEPPAMEMEVIANAGSSSATPADSKKSLVTAQVTNVEHGSIPHEPFKMTAPQWGVTVTMCWFAMTCFFILGAWEANIPVFTGSDSQLNPFHFSPFAAGNLIALGGVCTFPFLLANVFLARRFQDRYTLAVGTFLGSTGLFVMLAILNTRSVNYASLFMSWFLVALGFNLSSTVTLSLLSKQLPGKWNTRTSMVIQYSNYTGRVTGAIWGGSGVSVGMLNYVGMQIAIVGIGAILFSTLWRNLKAKTG